MQAHYPLWGEASWNTYGTFYYISGFIGYMLLGLYFRRFVSVVSWRKTIAVALPLYAVGFAVTAGGFIRRVMITDQGAFPVNGGIDTVAWWETTWGYDTVGVAMMTIACIMVMRKFTASGAVYRRMVLPVSKASYGMYLAHMIVLAAVSGILRETLCTGVNGVLGAWTTPVQILGTAVITFLIVALAAVVLQRIPRAGKYLIG